GGDPGDGSRAGKARCRVGLRGKRRGRSAPNHIRPHSQWGGGEAGGRRRGGGPRSQKPVRSATQEATVVAAAAAVSDYNDRLVPPDRRRTAGSGRAPAPGACRPP